MTRLARAAWFALTFGSLLAPSARAQTTVLAASCAQTDVAAAVSLATNGDTVVMPACSSTTPGGVNTWTTTLNVEVGIILQGQGIGNTVLIDNVPKGNSNCSGAGPLIGVGAGPNNFRITGFTIQGDAPDTNGCNQGHVQLNGTGNAIRVDHLNFANMQTSSIRVGICLYGVIDHNTFDLSENRRQGVVNFDDGCGGDSYGDYNWANPTGLGGPNFLFVETNVFIEKPGDFPAGDMDNFGGSRFVFRYNTGSFVASHGTESAQRFRSIRAFEIYNNTFTAVIPAQPEIFFDRGGTGVVWGNNYQDSGTNYYNGFLVLALFRDADAFPPWGAPGGSGNAGACDGAEPYDTNGSAQASGTVTTGGTRTFTDSSKNFAANQWAGASYTIRDVTQGFGYLIASNTATTVTAVPDIGYGEPGTFLAGDSYQILSAYPCIDQVGRGPGALLSGYVPAPAAPVNQALEPVYQWNNTHNGVAGSVKAGTDSTRILANRDYYDNTMLPGYTPYPYPHPLVTSTPGALPPTNPQGVPH